MQRFASLDLADARALLDTILRTAQNDGLPPVAIVVAGYDGTLLALATMDGCPPASVTVAMSKAHTVSRVRKDTIGYANRPTPFDPANWADPRMNAFGGGVAVLA